MAGSMATTVVTFRERLSLELPRSCFFSLGFYVFTHSQLQSQTVFNLLSLPPLTQLKAFEI